MYTNQHRDVFTTIARGFRVDRATDTLPTTAAESIFTVSGGRVLVTLLFGEVTVAIENQTCNLKVTVNPTTGTSGDVASNLDIDNDEAGTFYLVEGDSSALVGVSAGGSFFAAGTPAPIIVPVGTIDIETGATNTGEIKWTVYYLPLDEGAAIAAA